MTSEIVLFVAGSPGWNLEQVARCVFGALNLYEWEERFSSNYPPDDHYFAGYAKNVTVEVSDDEMPKKPGFPFFMSVRDATWRKGRWPIDTAQPTIVTALTTHGLRVFVPNGSWWLRTWDGSGESYAA